MPCFLQICFTSRMLAIDTGWPPPELLVIVSITRGIFLAPSRSISSWRRSVSMFPLKGKKWAGSLASGVGRSTAVAPTNSQFARVVSKCVLFGTTSPFLQVTLNKDAFRGTALVRGNHVAKSENSLYCITEAREARGTGIGLIAA